MGNELITIQPGQLQSAAQIRAQVNLIQQVMKAVMKPGIHYGTIPGCGDKPALFKPGAEKLLSTFGIAVSPEVEDLSGPDEARYRVRAVGMHGDIMVGAGIGEASSNEEKYKWRRAVCDEEFDETAEDRRREKWARGRDGNYKIKQVRTNIADVANTVLKMAKKRAQIDLTLTATAASDCFTQDIEDMPPEIAAEVAGQHPEAQGKPHVQMPQPVAEPPATPPAQAQRTGRKITGPQAKRLHAIATKRGVGKERVADLLTTYGYNHTADILMDDYDKIVATIERMQPDEREPGSDDQ